MSIYIISKHVNIFTDRNKAFLQIILIYRQRFIIFFLRSLSI